MNYCFSIITQVIIEIPKQRNVKFYHNHAIVDKSSYYVAHINVPHNAFLNSCSEEKTFSLTFINQNVIHRGLYSYRQWVRFIALFPNSVFLLLLHVEQVCKSF